MQNFQQHLEMLTVDELKTRLTLLVSGRKPTRKADIVQAITDDCMQNHQHYWNQLSGIEKKVVAEVLYQDEKEGTLQFHASRFQAKYGEMPAYFSKAQYTYPKPATKSYLALFFYNRQMPPIFKQWMKSYVKQPAAITIPTVAEDQIPEYSEIRVSSWQKENETPDQVPIKRLFMEEIAANDLETVLRFVETGQCAVSEKTNRASAATMRKLDKLLLNGDYFSADDEWQYLDTWSGSPISPIRSFAWPLLLQASGLAKRVGKKLQLTNNGKKALGAPLHVTVKTIYERWRNKSLLDEFSRIDEIKGQASKGRVMTAVAPRKQAIEKLLKQCPVDEWIGVDSLFQFIKATGITFGVTHNEWRLYISDREYGALGYQGFGTFEVLEGRYILVYFFEYLATIGLLDIAYTVPYYARSDFGQIWGTDDLVHLSRYDGLLYFRINPLGAYCLGMVNDYQAKITEKQALLEVHQDLSLHLLRQASPAEIMVLERYTRRMSETAWQLADEPMLAAMENRFSADELKAFLHENSEQSDLGELIDGFFAAANEREKSLEDMGAARLLHCYSEGFARMLANSTETKKYCLHAGGTVIVIPKKTRRLFMKGLHKLGYVYPQEKD